MTLKDFIGPLFALALFAVAAWLLRANKRSVNLSERESKMPRSWRANLLEHEKEQESLGHTYGTRSLK